MILEIALIEVKAGSESKFEAGVKNAPPLFKAAKGCNGLALRRSVEHPHRYRLMIEWATVENHTVDFRGPTDFQKWRALLADCFDGAPQVKHAAPVLEGF
ncbi:MAG: antibiotic biosynthesis monooxygenase family protein [Stellaceae bacterium]